MSRTDAKLKIIESIEETKKFQVMLFKPHCEVIYAVPCIRVCESV